MDGRLLSISILLAISAFLRAQPVEELPTGPAEILPLVEFRGVPLKEVLPALSDQTGFNLVASSQALETPVTLYLRDVTPSAALDSLTRAHKLWSRRDPETDIIHLYTVDEYQRDLSSFREEKTEVFTLLYPNPVDVASAIGDLYGERVQLSFGAQDSTNFQDLSERFDRFDMVDGRSQGLGFFQGGGGGGGGGGGSFGSGGGAFNSGGAFRGGFQGAGRGGPGGRRSDFLRQGRVSEQVTQRRSVQREELESLGWTPEMIQRFERALEEGATPEQELVQQYLQLQRANIYVTVLRRHNQLIVRTSDESTMQQIRELIAQLDIPTPLVLLEVKVLEITLDDDFNSVFDYQFSDGSGVAGGFTTGNILPPASDANTNPVRQFQNIGIPGQTLTNSTPLTFQFVDANFRLRMQLLENKNRVTVLTTPLLLTANNEVSRLFVGEEVPLNRSFSGPQPIASNVTGATPVFAPGATDIEFRPVGTTLLLTPNINADRTVTLRILQELSQVTQNGATVQVPTSTGFAPTMIDTVDTRSVSGTVVAKDGLAVAIGGLIREDATDMHSQVPVLGRVPGLGFFFRRQTTGRSKTELVIMIRPYVFNTPTESAEASRTVMQELSVHPTTLSGEGTLHSFRPDEPVRPVPSMTPLHQLLRMHSVEPKAF